MVSCGGGGGGGGGSSSTNINHKGLSSSSTNINYEGLQRTANEYAAERRIYKDLISKNNNKLTY